LLMKAAGPAILGFVGVLRAYAARKPKLNVELKKADGTVLTVNAENLQSHHFDAIIRKYFEAESG